MVTNIEQDVLQDIKTNIYNCCDTLTMINSACVLEHDFTYATGPLSIVIKQLLANIKSIDELLGTNHFSTEELEYEQ